MSVAILITALGGATLAVHDDGVFELDRNALDGITAGDDWENIDDGNSSADATTGIQFDGRGPTIFTTGGSKDDLNTTGWKHKSGAVPDKDELLDAYAARYGDVVYFGADRYDASGAAALGLWFFQEDVGALPGGSFGPGQHQDGDILILSDFTQGGGITTIRVFAWNGPGGTRADPADVNGVLDIIAGTNDPSVGIVADCVGPPAVGEPDPFCATVNALATPAPWPFVPKGTAAGSFAPGELYEGGIDLSAFPELAGSCFASFLAETRTSPSVGSQLKDFVGGGFEDCTTDVTTTPSNADGDPVGVIQKGGSIHDYALIEGTGSDNHPEGEMEFFICSPAQLTGGVCATGGTEVNGDGVGALNPAVAVAQIGTTATSEALSSAFTPTSTGTWCWRGEYSGDDRYPPDSDSSTGECFLVVDAKISVTPLVATNEVSTNHVVTATVEQDTGSGLVKAPAGTVVAFSLANNLAGATFVADGVDSIVDGNSGNDCVTVGTTGQCTVTITTSTTGDVDIHATTTFSVGGLSLTRATGSTGNSDDANKRFVDAQIDLDPLDDTNGITENHTITATVQQDDGLAANTGGGDAADGFGSAPNGTLVTFSFASNPGGIGSFVGGVSTCNTTAGSCSIQIVSASAGTVVVHATTTFNIGPDPVESVTRATGTGGNNSTDASKTFVAGSLAWFKNNNAGTRLGGATFTVCRTLDRFGVAVSDTCIVVTDGTAPDTDADAGEFKLINLKLGHYTVTETTAPPGYVGDSSVKEADLTLALPDATISIAFVNGREILKISGFGYTNTGTPPFTNGIVTGSSTFSLNLHNYGTTTANLTGSSIAISVTGAGAGTVTCNGDLNGGLTKAVSGTVAAGGDLGPISITCTYTNVADGTVISALATVNSITNGVTRPASGSPATISFTVQSN